MADLRGTYSTQIALVLQRMKDRDVNLDDLDPSRRNTRNVTLMGVERMKLPVLNTRTVLSSTGTFITEDVAGTKNSVNTSFTISNTPQVGSILLFHNNVAVKKVGGSAVSGEFSISGSTITMGLAPDSSDSLIAQYVVA